MRSSIVVAVLVAMWTCSFTSIRAQERATGGMGAAAAKYMPDDAIGSITVWPARTMKLPRFRLAPIEVATAAGLEQVGIDPLKIQRLDVMFAFPGPAGPQFGAVVQLEEAVDLNSLNPQIFEGGLQTEKNFSYMTLSGLPQEVVVHAAAPKTLLIGTKIFVKRMVAEKKQPAALAPTLTAVGDSQEALALISISAIRPILEGAVEGMEGQAPPPIVENVTTLTKTADFVAIRLSLDATEKLQVMASAIDEQSAISMEKSLSNLVNFMSDMIVQQAKAGLPRDDSETSAAMQKYIDRVSTEITATITPKRTGKRVTLEVEGIENTATIGTLVGLLLPAVQASREAARRVNSLNNLKQLGLALHNYHDANQAFPATASVDKASGKPLLSWRVAVLPYIEEADLYNQFHHDEPWDSPHNIKLLDKMPATFKHAGRATEPGYTVYQAPVNDLTLLRKDSTTSMRTITDGTSNTLMLVETSEEVAVPWTAPEDLEIDFANPLNGLLSPTSPQIFQALFGDGSVRAIAANVDENVLNALFTRGGGEVIPNF